MGGGGSILTVPVLVYTAGVSPVNATAYSLFIVGISALYGAFVNYKSGNFNKSGALIFGPISILAVLATRALIIPAIPNIIYSGGDFSLTKDLFVMLFFSVVMLLASISMIKGRSGEQSYSSKKATLALSGAFTGFIAGMAGAGGGFLIVPALIFFGKLDMKKAVGTSLAIISAQSLIGFFLGDALSGLEIDWNLLLIFSGIAIVGIIFGINLSKKINGASLKKYFGYFILIMSIFIFLQELIIKG